MAHPGRYTIVRKIADGGMAEIFLATQRGAEGFERPVVLKRILAALVADPQFRNMMIDEAHVAMSLNHSNIAQVLDLGHAGGRYFLVLELVDGWDLNLIINRAAAAGLPIPPELALYVSAEVCRALSYAHARTRDGRPLGIVHRDVSPHNVLVSDHGEVKLTDFGIAKALGRRERTGAGIIKGKLAFMSPEQASGTPLDARSDLFSVGTMLYLMSTGRRPFEAPTDLEAILRVRQCDFPPPRTIKPELEPKLAAVILRAMKLAPGERYQSAEEMLVDIEAVQRTVFQPAGQTELKRWLSALQERDGIAPIGRASRVPAPAADVSDSDLIEGKDLVFDDDSDPGQTIAGGSPFDFARPATPPPLPRGVGGAPEPTPSLPAPAAAAARPRHRLRALLVLALAAGAGVLYLRSRRPPPEPEAPVAQAPPPAPLAASAPKPSPVASQVPAPAPVAAPTPKPATPPQPAATPDAQMVAAERHDAGRTAAVAEPAEPAEDEQALLEHAEPDADKKVIGEELPAPSPPPARTPGRAHTPEPIPVVSVHITTRPAGAVIRLKNRVFGRAPMSLRFRPGIPFDLSFVKTGYLTRTRRFTFGKRKNQSIMVTLERRSEKKKSLFQRLFGG